MSMKSVLELELFQSITASPKKKCPSCGALKLERIIGTGAGVIFKGSGFYETDYRSKSYEDGKKSDSEKKKADSKPAESKKSDTKGAGKKSGGAKKKSD